ncbi:MAG: glycosyltransferase [Acidobacteriota bacterium]
MRRLLLIASQPFLEWRGSPIRVMFNVRCLAELGLIVDLLTLPVGRRIQIPGVHIIRVPNLFLAHHVPIGPSIIKVAFGVLLLVAAVALVIRRRYAVIHGVEDAGAIALTVARLTGSRFLYEKHSDPASYRGGLLRNFVMNCYSRVERFLARRADAVICTGPGLGAQVRKIVPSDRVFEIPDIPSSLAEPDGERARAIRQSLCDQPGQVLATYVGSFAVYQGIDVMFQAIPHVVARHPEARFAIIGGSPDEIARYRAMLGEKGCENAVTFLGQIPPEDLPHYLSASDILLSPRLSGVNTPLKLLDYLKAGRAIVAADTEANRLLLDSTLAVLAAPEPEAFGAEISRLIQDAALREELGRRGKRLFTDEYSFDKFKRRMAACYRDGLGMPVLEEAPMSGASADERGGSR